MRFYKDKKNFTKLIKTLRCILVYPGIDTLCMYSLSLSVVEKPAEQTRKRHLLKLPLFSLSLD